MRTLQIIASLFIVACCGPQEGAPCSETAANVDTAANVSFRNDEGVNLVERGERPFRRLQYNVAIGTMDHFRIEVIMASAAALEEQATPILVAPPMGMEVAVGPVQPADDDGMRYELIIDHVALAELPDANPDAMEMINQVISPLAEVNGHVEVDRRGVTRSTEFNVPSTVTDRTRTFLGNIRASLGSVPFPDEEIGVGARWEVVRNISHTGVAVVQTVTYSLLQLRGNTGRLVMTLRQTAAPQDAPSPAPGARSYLEAYESTGIGYVDFDLTHLTPTSQVDFGSFTRGHVLSSAGRSQTMTRQWGSVRVYSVSGENADAEAEPAESTPAEPTENTPVETH